ncbi:MAG: hypothetical protein OJF49_001000 [Ktedonobacterales bacterium]|jgi:pimeloyl-ACP methyl ester carboxylesterase|nr:MAG: hypothetical protein OJF49_001000 [Ktedonobacterales bacterium]
MVFHPVFSKGRWRHAFAAVALCVLVMSMQVALSPTVSWAHPSGNGPQGKDGLYIVGSGGWSGSSSTSDAAHGWGDDQWQINPTHTTRVYVTVTDCCIVGDNFTVYIDGHAIGTTPPEPLNGSTASKGTESHLVGPGKHLITIQDIGGIKYYRQGNSYMIPAGYSVSISLKTESVDQPVIFVHGIGQDSSKAGFGSLYSAINHAFGANPTTFDYVDDRADGTGCKQPPCDSQSAVLDNAKQLAQKVADAYSSKHQKVTLIGYSMGAAIIRTMLAGCPESGDTTCQQAHTHVNAVYFIEGVQQGSVLLQTEQGFETAIANGMFLGGVTADPAMVAEMAVAEWAAHQVVQTALHLNLNDLAEADLAPVSDNILLRNGAAPPRGIDYYNFYGDIQIGLKESIFGWTLPATLHVGDLVILPGTDNPQDTPDSGGSRFCQGCGDHAGFESKQIDSSTSFTQWALTDTIYFTSGQMYSCLNAATTLNASDWQTCLDAFTQLFKAPEFHTNIPDTINSITVHDNTGAKGSVTLPQEIVRHMELEAGILP